MAGCRSLESRSCSGWRSVAVVEQMLASDSGEAIYGVNTGFGSLCACEFPPTRSERCSRNLIRSHAAGVGEPLADDVVRAMLLLLAASLCRGCSGVRIEVVDLIVGMLNAGITPIVPARLGWRIRRPCPAGPCRPRPHRRRIGARQRHNRLRRDARLPTPSSNRSRSKPKKASQSSTAPI